MASESRSNTVKTHDEILARIRGLTTGIRMAPPQRKKRGQCRVK